MPTKTDHPTVRRSLILMLASVVLFSINTLAIRAVSVHFPAADGWIASLFRGVVGMVVVFALHGWGRGLRMDRLFAKRLVALRGVIGGLAIIIFYVTIVKLGAARAVILNLTYHTMSVAKRSSIQMLLPIVTGIGGFLCFGETFHPVEILGATLTLLATWRVVVGR